MRFKQGMSLDDLNFGMENYSSLVNVKLLLDARVQNSTCATYEKCNNRRTNSEIGYTTDCLYSF